MKSTAYGKNDVTDLQNQAGDLQNDARRCAAPSTPEAQRRSPPVLLQLLGSDGKKHGKFSTPDDLAKEVERLWDDQEQADDVEPGRSVQLAG